MIDIANKILSLTNWIEGEEFIGYDPFDALNSPINKRLTFGSKKIAQVLVQLYKVCPVNLRSLIGVKKSINQKGMGVLLAAYSRRYFAFGESQDLKYANYFANWLLENGSPGFNGICWGYNFDWPNRNFYAPAGTPTIVNTGFIGLAFLDYAFALRKANQSSDCAIQTAISACEFILCDLNKFVGVDELCFSYTPLDHRFVHNANMLGAWLLSEVYLQNKNSTYAENALSAARFTADRIETNGSWKYGVNSNDDWVDNFHTGYVLVSLKEVSKNLGTNEFRDQITRGYEFWKKNFFLADGTPKFYPNSVYPIDSHSIAQAILTFLEFRDLDSEALEWALRVADWGCKNMQDPEGFFYYQKTKYYTNKIPYMRWTEAWMLRALTELNIVLNGEEYCV